MLLNEGLIGFFCYLVADYFYQLVLFQTKSTPGPNDKILVKTFQLMQQIERIAAGIPNIEPDFLRSIQNLTQNIPNSNLSQLLLTNGDPDVSGLQSVDGVNIPFNLSIPSTNHLEANGPIFGPELPPTVPTPLNITDGTGPVMPIPPPLPEAKLILT